MSDWKAGDKAECIRTKPWESVYGKLPDKLPQAGEICRVVDAWVDAAHGPVIRLAEYDPDYGCFAASPSFRKVEEAA